MSFSSSLKDQSLRGLWCGWYRELNVLQCFYRKGKQVACGWRIAWNTMGETGETVLMLWSSSDSDGIASPETKELASAISLPRTSA